jgi:hypothetical protein
MPFPKGILKHQSLKLHETAYLVHNFHIHSSQCIGGQLDSLIANEQKLR